MNAAAVMNAGRPLVYFSLHRWRIQALREYECETSSRPTVQELPEHLLNATRSGARARPHADKSSSHAMVGHTTAWLGASTFAERCAQSTSR
jgi:hypothetical protein